MTTRNWTSPSHSNLKSSDFTTLCRGKPLTDRRIDHYKALGFYGISAQQAILAKRAAREAKKPRTLSSPVTLESLEDLLA